MPTIATLSTQDKSRVKAAVPSATNKILTACLARVYYAYPDPDSWSYAGLQGALVLTMDKNTNGFGFKLVDLHGTKGIVWEHEIWEPFEFHMDRPFFCSFAGDVSGRPFSFVGWN
jgi:neural Wiskott-Aldrich syndrome protein